MKSMRAIGLLAVTLLATVSFAEDPAPVLSNEQIQQALTPERTRSFTPTRGLARRQAAVAGHTDAKGSAAYNKTLSLRRAQAVKSFLVSKGMDPKRLETVGYGSEKLLTPDRPQDPSNRRVEIRDIGAAAH